MGQDYYPCFADEETGTQVRELFQNGRVRIGFQSPERIPGKTTCLVSGTEVPLPGTSCKEEAFRVERCRFKQRRL